MFNGGSAGGHAGQFKGHARSNWVQSNQCTAVLIFGTWDLKKYSWISTIFRWEAQFVFLFYSCIFIDGKKLINGDERNGNF